MAIPTNVVSVDLRPSILLKIVPVTSETLERVLVSNHIYELRLLSFLGEIPALAEQALRVIAQLAGRSEADFRVCPKTSRFALPTKRISGATSDGPIS